MLSGAILANASTSATDRIAQYNPYQLSDTEVMDQVNITVPVSCSMEGTGMNSHETELLNNEHDSNVGTTNIKAYCNDSNGFAIYAIGYTDNIDGKNVLTDSNLSSTNDITTGVATSGNASKWAMKLATVTNPQPTYPITILSDQEGSFTSFHTVPDDYTMVAKRTAATDAGSSAIGSTFTTTYQIYIGPNQSAGTYNGQVKYVLVHPNYVDQETLKNAITVIFDGNGLTFPGGATTNTVKYAKIRNQGESAYVSNTVGGISKSQNLNNDGTMNTPIATDDYNSDTVTINGADKLKIVLNYDFDPAGTTSSDANCYVNIGDNYNLYQDYYGMGTDIITAEGDTAYFYFNCWGAVNQNHNYGYYAQVYPAYDTEQPNTTSEVLPSNKYSILPISGTYLEPTNWQDKWTMAVDGYHREFDRDDYCEQEWCEIDNTARGDLLNWIDNDYDSLTGTTVTIQAYNPYTNGHAQQNFHKFFHSNILFLFH